MNTKSIIEIFRGDDSDALGYQTIVGTIHTDLDLTGCKAVFRYLGFFQEFDPIPEDGKLTIVIPSASSMRFPPGFGYASLKVYDIDRKVRTFTNRIPVFVKTMTPCRGGGEFDVEFSPFPELEPLKIFVGPNAYDFDLYTGFISKIIDRASAQKYGLSMLFDAMDAEKTAEGGCAASPAAVKAAYDAIIGVLADNYYTAEQTDEAIDRVAAYYITYDAAGNPFPTYAALTNATTVYSGGKVRVPTRNDYCVVLADETHQGAEYRYIYAIAEGQTTGNWQPQFPVEGVMTIDQTVQKNSQNPVSGGGVWSAIWGALAALPTGFSSLYDWCVAQLAGKASTADVTLNQGYTDWVCNPATSANDEPYFVAWDLIPDTDVHAWCLFAGIPGDADFVNVGTEIANAISFTAEGRAEETVTATRTASGYILGPEDPSKPNYDKSLASEAEAEGLRKGKLNNSGDQTLNGSLTLSGVALTNGTIIYNGSSFSLSPWSGGTLALIEHIAPDFSAQDSYEVGQLVVQNFILKRCTAAGTGSTAVFTSATVEDVLAALRTGKANDSAVVHKSGDTMTGSLHMGDNYLKWRNGNLIYWISTNGLYIWDDGDDVTHSPSHIIEFPLASGTFALTSAIPYSLGTPIEIDTASSEVVEGETVYYGAATLADRTANIVQVTAATALDELRITFPAATSGKVRDFGLRVEIGTGSAALAAPALVPIAPTGETIKIENADRAIPALADGTATAKGVTLLYFSENAPGVFVVKGESVEEVA